MSSLEGHQSERKTDTKEAAANFWQGFQKEREAIQQALASLYTKPKSSITFICDKILERINDLEKKLTEATIYLPPYDQRQLSLQIKFLIDELNTQRASLAPKSKFSFKSRKTSGISGATIASGNIPETKKSQEKTATIIKAPVTTTINATTDPNIRIITLDNRQNSLLFINSYIPLSMKLDDVKKTGGILDFQLSNLSNCIVNLVSPKVIIGAIQIKGLKNTLVVAGPVASSILIHDCEQCVFVVGCHQFRMHASKKITIYLHVTSHPIIEDCHEIQFAPYTLLLDGLESMFKAAKLDPKVNKYEKVEDFNWLRQQASPNWSLVPEEKLRKQWPALVASENIDQESKIVTEDIVAEILTDILG
ncbi:hypothetical protein G9A89_018790 [Geosiphon pyriformis]|nr:hypothetical protein G9A89_018790 [Geosiphon pyriformis]